jgi:hypothetical protein
MSDYLWDKKGEPDAEVARLEALLGAFAHEPRRLELPAEAATPEPRPRWRLPFAPRLFAPAALAAAVALLVASILVASAFLRSRVPTRDEHVAAPESSRPTRDAPKDERPAPRRDERGMLEPPPPAGASKGVGQVESAAVSHLPNVAPRRKAAQPAAVLRRQKQAPAAEAVADGTGAGGFTLEAMSTRGGTAAFVENARLLTKEQLVYALRLTGAKLRDVRQRAQGAESSRQ